MSNQNEWLLFVDETGDFDTPNESVSIVGWLVRQADTPDFDAALRRAIDQLFPRNAYPPHATLLNIPISHLAQLRLFGPAPADVPAWAAGGTARWDRLCALNDSAVQRVVACVQNGCMPNWDECNAADSRVRWLDRPLHQVMDAQRLRKFDQMTALLALLDDALSPSGSWLVGASMPETLRSSPATPPDHYLHLLDLLFARVFALLRSTSKEVHTVKTFVAGRRVWVHELLQKVYLRNLDVGACVRRAERFPFLPPSDGHPDDNVRILPFDIEETDARVRPGIVIADFAANRLRHVLAGSRRWPDVKTQAAARIALPVVAPARAGRPDERFPTMALAGSSAEVIVQAFSQSKVLPVSDTQPGWGADQAARWVQAAARWQ